MPENIIINLKTPFKMYAVILVPHNPCPLIYSTIEQIRYLVPENNARNAAFYEYPGVSYSHDEFIEHLEKGECKVLEYREVYGEKKVCNDCRYKSLSFEN